MKNREKRKKKFFRDTDHRIQRDQAMYRAEKKVLVLLEKEKYDVVIFFFIMETPRKVDVQMYTSLFLIALSTEEIARLGFG